TTVRRAAVAALGEIGDSRATAPLVGVLSDPGLQTSALESLRRTGAAALPELERAFHSGRLEPDLRRLLVDLASRLEDPAALRLLLAGLQDAAPSVRVEAASALGEGGFREALRPLLERKSKDASPEVRQAAAAALRKLAPR
ncbi:MAG TPA: HEAT repeat domain-containing protein, partial [Vicinamibacteria bacterium]|nr:HEAT repeat domain-containing protein [Vicinamibacteria bacterium]